ncbi:pulmonary surfactant-associated protein D-like [Agelaius tricolor]|uniref:pulmonary surfactant-associated protein D-like n=1 Tax=Agelaius tricolor TaxID=9191 RepID=UPI0039F23F30
MPSPPHDSGGGGSGGSPGPAIKREGKGPEVRAAGPPGRRAAERARRGWRQAEPAGEREAVPSHEPPPSLAPALPPAGIPGGAAAPGTRGSPGLHSSSSGSERSERGSRAARRSRRLILRHRPGQRRWQCRSQEQKLAETVFCVRDYEECTHD